jgi:hypothetical protein
VVVVGLAVGLLTLVLLKPVDGLQLYVLPTTAVAPIEPLVVVHVKVISAPAFATGAKVFTFTTTTSVAVQPLTLLVAVNVYVVVTPGLAVGLLTLLALNALVGLQL